MWDLLLLATRFAHFTCVNQSGCAERSGSSRFKILFRWLLITLVKYILLIAKPDKQEIVVQNHATFRVEHIMTTMGMMFP